MPREAFLIADPTYAQASARNRGSAVLVEGEGMIEATAGGSFNLVVFEDDVVVSSGKAPPMEKGHILEVHSK
jgi:hypothetical protein